MIIKMNLYCISCLKVSNNDAVEKNCAIEVRYCIELGFEKFQTIDTENVSFTSKRLNII